MHPLTHFRWTRLPRPVLLALIVIAACGLAISAVTHVLSFTNYQLDGLPLFFALHAGVFVVGLPMFFIFWEVTHAGSVFDPPENSIMKRRRFSFMKLEFAGCPRWLRWLGLILYIYLIPVFVITFLECFGHGGEKFASPPAFVWRYFSVGWMYAYFASMAGLITAYRLDMTKLIGRCVNGHLFVTGDGVCRMCGGPRSPWA